MTKELTYGACVSTSARRWDGETIEDIVHGMCKPPGGRIKIYYYFDSKLPKEFQRYTEEAIKELQANAPGLEFQYSSTAKNRIRIIPDPEDTKSYVGMQGGEQRLWLANWAKKHDVIHELMHALGFMHEHVRPDRNDCVCVAASFQDDINYRIAPDGYAIGEYDFDSIMHYPTSQWMTRNDRKPMSKKNETLSPGDIEALNKLYPPVNSDLQNRYREDRGRYLKCFCILLPIYW